MKPNNSFMADVFRVLISVVRLRFKFVLAREYIV